MRYENSNLPQRHQRCPMESDRTPPPCLPRRAAAEDRPTCGCRCGLLHPAYRLLVALPAQGLSAEEYRVALLRRVAAQRHPRYHPRPAPHQGPDGREALCAPTDRERGRDNAKNVDGRKRHIVVDSMGLLLAVLVTAADVDDAKAAATVFARLEDQPMSRVGRMFADSKYHNHALYKWVGKQARWELVIVSRPKGAEGWVKLPLRWTVERTFAWLGKWRRLSKDRERTVLSAEAFIKLAMIHLMLNRLEPKEVDAEFHYRTVA